MVADEPEAELIDGTPVPLDDDIEGLGAASEARRNQFGLGRLAARQLAGSRTVRYRPQPRPILIRPLRGAYTPYFGSFGKP